MPRLASPPIKASHISCPGVGQTHTRQAGITLTTIIIVAIHKAMVTAESVRESRLIITVPPPQQAAEIRTITAPTLTAASPGRRIIKAPASPTTTADQRRMPMRSRRKITAPRDAKIAFVKLNAVASASGTMLRP